MTKFLIGTFAAIIAAAAFLSGSASAQTGEARLRVLHASPDAPAVDVYLDGSEAISDLAFGDITDYVTVPAGNHAVKVYPSSANGTGTPVIDVASVALEAGKDYTVAAAGNVASIEPVVFTDNNAAPASGKAHVRVIHLSPDAPNVDIFAQGAGVVVPNLAFKAASDYLPLAAGSYNLEVRAAGSSTAVLSLPNTGLEGGKVYTAWAVGLAGGQPALTVKLTTDATHQQPAPSAATLPSAGGPPVETGSDTALLLALAGASLIVVTLAAGYVLTGERIRK
jgi:hypothetical protein